MIQFACDSLYERGITLLLFRDRKHEPARVTIVPLRHVILQYEGSDLVKLGAARVPDL